MIVAQGSFEDPGVLIIITPVNLTGAVALSIAAKIFSRDNAVQLIEPVPVNPARRAKI